MLLPTADMPRRRSPFQRAKDESVAMDSRNERAALCLLGSGHKPHVLGHHMMAGGKDVPCGGGELRVDKHADRDVWDKP